MTTLGRVARGEAKERRLNSVMPLAVRVGGGRAERYVSF